MNTSGVLCAGRIYCDLVFTGMDQLPVLGREVFSNAVTLHAGGGAFISASYFSALGNTSYVMGMLPTQPFAGIVEAEACANDVMLSYCEHEHEAAPQLTVAMSMNEERAFLTSRQGSALPECHASVLETCAGEGTVSHLHIGELATLLEYPELVKLAKRAGLSVSLDCGWDDECFNNPTIGDLIAQVDVFLPNAAEMTRLIQSGINETAATLTVVKQGAQGATAHRGGCKTTQLAARQKVVDTIGAGDAFNAGFISAWRQGCSLDQCLKSGNACGSVAVSRAGGATGMPNSSDMGDAVRGQINNHLRPA